MYLRNRGIYRFDAAAPSLYRGIELIADRTLHGYALYTAAEWDVPASEPHFVVDTRGRILHRGPGPATPPRSSCRCPARPRTRRRAIGPSPASPAPDDTTTATRSWTARERGTATADGSLARSPARPWPGRPPSGGRSGESDSSEYVRHSVGRFAARRVPELLTGMSDAAVFDMMRPRP